jgi:hypothetical protein
VIPIAVFTRIDAGTASSSAFQQKPKIVHDHAGIRVHVDLESAFTMRWKPRSPWAGICTKAPRVSGPGAGGLFLALELYLRRVRRPSCGPALNIDGEFRPSCVPKQ